MKTKRIWIFLLILTVLASAGCNESADDIVQSIPETEPNETALTNLTFVQKSSPPEFPAEYMEMKEYRDSLSEPRKKLAHKLLILIDQDYPVLPGQTAEQLKKQFVFVPAGETNKLISEEPVLNDTILVEVDLTEDVDTRILDPYISKALYRDEKYHDATVWVEVNNLEKITLLEGVKFIKPVYPEPTD